MPAAPESAWVDAEVIDVCRADGPDDPLRRPHIVVLGERNGTRRLPMYTGSAEAVALACSLDATEMPRPMVYQLAANLLIAAGSRLTEVRVTRLAEGIFYAVVVLEGPGGVVEVDARPSDALNLAVVCGAPVRVDAAVLGDPEVDAHLEWEQYPARMLDLAAEERQRRADFLARLAREHEPEDRGFEPRRVLPPNGISSSGRANVRRCRRSPLLAVGAAVAVSHNMVEQRERGSRDACDY